MLMHIVTQLLPKKLKKHSKEVFTYLDKNGDGMISRKELLEAYAESFNKKDITESVVDNIIDALDLDYSGFINFSGNLYLT